MLLEDRKLDRKLVWEPHVVVIQKCDIRSGTRLDAGVSGSGRPMPIPLQKIPSGGIPLHHLTGGLAVRVIHDDDFHVEIPSSAVLCIDRTDATVQRLGTTVGRDDDADARFA
jgi:hypothetical protein